jgi:plastocyanin domain-containing protein
MAAFLIIFVVLMISFSTQLKETKKLNTQNAGMPEIRGDGSQLIKVLAKVGYTPSVVYAKANVPTQLQVDTKGTFDCSSAFVIPKLGIRKNLPPSGSTSFDLGSYEAGTKLTAICSMGMYKVDMFFN